MKRKKRKWPLLVRALLFLALASAVCLAGVVGFVCWKEATVPMNQPYDAIIVLGAQVKEDGSLSVQLQGRLDAALTAWQASPCVVVTCGAQGTNEPAPEGEVMREYLIEQGIPREQLLAETASFNTRQNIRNALVLLEGQDVQSVLMVTSNYHLPRALALAEDEGVSVSGIGSPTKPEYWLKNHLREALSWLKYWGQKYLHLPLT